MRCRRIRGFTLVEVVLAVGVFAVGVVGALVLMSTISRTTAKVRDAATAIRVAESVAAIVRSAENATAQAWLAENHPAPIHASRRGERIGLHEDVPAADAYFEVRLTRLPGGPESVSSVMPIWIQVSWPVMASDGNATVAMEAREVFTLNGAIAP